MIPGPEYFNKRITLQHITRAPNGRGGFTETWADWRSLWAHDTPHRSNEAVEAMKTTGTQTHNWRIRYRQGVSGDMRIKRGNKYMAIVGPPIEVDFHGQRCLDLTSEESK